MNIWEFFLWLFWLYILFACIWIFISVFIDIFRDRELGGWAKAGWVIFLVFVPFLAALIYMVARGRGMAERNAARMQSAQAENADYIRTVAGTTAASPSAEIEKAKQLLDSGAITPAEYEALKAKALQSA